MKNTKEDYLHQCFDVLGTLGCGSFGTAVRVRSREDGQLYAVKHTREAYRSPTDRRQKLEEVKKHELVPNHPNIIKFIAAWEENGCLYIQTELCEKSLAEVCRQEHEIPEQRVWSYFADILKAVHHLHSNGLLHLDIKPENIFVTRNDVCKLGDFGLALDLHKDDLHSATEGDCKYLASEILNNPPTKAADIFSLGITVLELATDMDLPSDGAYWSELRMGYVRKEFLQNLSSELTQCILAMLNPTPSLRPTAAELLRVQSQIARNRLNGGRPPDFVSL